MVPKPSDSENYKLLFSMLSQVDTPKLDWASIGADLNIAAGAARTRWKTLEKRSASKVTGESPARKKTYSGPKKAPKPKNAIKRKAEEMEGKDEDEALADDEDAGSDEENDERRGKQARAYSAKRVETKEAEDEFENGDGGEDGVEGYGAAELGTDNGGFGETSYYQDVFQLEQSGDHRETAYYQDEGELEQNGNDVEQYATQQVDSGEDGESAVQQRDQYYDCL
jgi:hypothetical protein